MYPFSTPENIRKPYGFLLFSGGRERVNWERMGWQYSSIPFNDIKMRSGKSYSSHFPLVHSWGLVKMDWRRKLTNEMH